MGERQFSFVAVEGIDGSGKTTTMRLIAEQVRAAGYPLSRIGQHSWLDVDAARLIIAVREGREHRRSVGAINDAYFRDKVRHAGVVKQLLKTRNVLADRYVFSDAVYLEVLYGVPAKETLQRHHDAGTVFPDLLVYLDVPADKAFSRVQKRSKSIRHYENAYTLGQVRTVYQRLLTDPPPYLPPVHIFRNDDGAHDDNRLTALARKIEDTLRTPGDV